MKSRFRLFQRGGKDGFFYAHDNTNGKQQSLNTKNKKQAGRLLHNLNEANEQPAINLQIARGYLLASDSRYNERTWKYVLETVTAQKQGSTQLRWLRVGKDKALAALWSKPLVQTKADDLLHALKTGTVSTNVFLRRLHNFAVDMAWLPASIIPKRQWDKVEYGEHRAITLEEHKSIMDREQNSERKAFYQICWIFGGSQTDMASLCAENIDWEHRLLTYQRRKTDEPAKLHFGAEAETILKQLPAKGPLFPNLRKVRESDRATEFKQRCIGLEIDGVTLHSYRYAWAERAKKVGYPERFAQQALGHNSKAVTRAYASQADMTLPALEDYERKAEAKIIPMPTRSEPQQTVATG